MLGMFAAIRKVGLYPKLNMQIRKTACKGFFNIVKRLRVFRDWFVSLLLRYYEILYIYFDSLFVTFAYFYSIYRFNFLQFSKAALYTDSSQPPCVLIDIDGKTKLSILNVVIYIHYVQRIYNSYMINGFFFAFGLHIAFHIQAPTLQNNIDILICIACTNHDVSPRIYCCRLNPFSVFGECVKEEININTI